MKRYIWILLAFALITDLVFAEAVSLKYEQDIILLPVKDWEYIYILVEADIVVRDNALYSEFFPDKTSLLAFVDDIVCVRLRQILADSMPDEIQSRLNNITEELANKIDATNYELRPSKRGIKLENLKLTLK